MSHKDKKPKTPAPTLAKAQYKARTVISEQLASLAEQAEAQVDGLVDAAKENVDAIKRELEAQIEAIDEKIVQIGATLDAFKALLKPSAPKPKLPQIDLMKKQLELRTQIQDQINAAIEGDGSPGLLEQLNAKIKSIDDTIQGLVKAVTAFALTQKPDVPKPKLPQVDLMKQATAARAALSDQLTSLAEQAEAQVDGLVSSAKENVDAAKKALEDQVTAVDEKIVQINEATDTAKEVLHNLG